jgi:prevent-host-death family protein
MVTRRRRATPVVRETPGERRIGVRDLKAKLSEYLREVKAGGTIVVTEHGRAVARLVPEAQTLHEKLQVLADSGLIAWSGRPLPPARPVGRVRGAKTLSDLILDERDRG